MKPFGYNFPLCVNIHGQGSQEKSSLCFHFFCLAREGHLLTEQLRNSSFSSLLMLQLRHGRDLEGTQWRQQEPCLLCLRKVHALGVSLLVPWPTTTLPCWGGTSHLSYVPTTVEEDEMGRPDRVCSSYFRGCSLCNTAQALQLLPALSLCWQAFWPWINVTATNLGCEVWGLFQWS